VAIAALVIWLCTAAAGMTLLVRGSTARRDAAAARSVPARPVPAPAAAPAPVPVRVPGAGRGPDGEMPDIPRVKVHATPGEHPLLEFFHPALGLVGFGLWFIYVGTGHRPLAWVAFGVLVVTIGAGLSWLIRSARSARSARAGQAGRAAQGEPAGEAAGGPRRGLPPRLILLHGLLATATFALVVLTALVASHG
jgi:hypothetical protein